MKIEWTTKTPRKCGFYWADGGHFEGIRTLQVFKICNTMYWWEFGGYNDFRVSHQWMGHGISRSTEPLEVPK